MLPAILTLLNADQSFNEPAQRALVRWLLAKGVDGFYVGGSTGEGPILSPGIRMQLIRCVVDETAGRVPVIAYVGFADTLQSAEMAEFAQKSGADGVSAVPPYYYGYDFEAIYSFYKTISERITIPMVVYYIQSARTMNNGELEKLLGLANVCGLKFTGSDHYAMQQAKQVAGEKFIFSGRDEQCLSGLLMNADGLIGSTYNVLPEIYLEIIDAYTAGDLRLAEKKAYAANLALAELVKSGFYMGSIKALLSLVGIDAPTTRSPMPSINPEQLTDLRSRLAKLKQVPELANVSIIQAT
jgi:N-acetylneuraminate lyase